MVRAGRSRIHELSWQRSETVLLEAYERALTRRASR
jgi:hypothetical protein